jgi:hypothetical protein
MKPGKSKRVFGLLAASVVLLCAGSVTPVQADDALCPLGNATLRGNYMSRTMGTVVGVGPVTAVGRFAYDGNGNFVNPGTRSLNGVIATSTDTGTYTVNSDCSGSVASSDGSFHFNFVTTADGSRYDFIRTDPGTVVSGTAIRLTPRVADH